MSRRSRVLASLLLVELLVVATLSFIVWAVGAPPATQVLLLRIVLVSLLITSGLTGLTLHWQTALMQQFLS